MTVKSVSLDWETMTTYGFGSAEDGRPLLGMVTASAYVLCRVRIGNRPPIEDWVKVDARASDPTDALVAMWKRAREAAPVRAAS
jgi:hypothetical protein